MEVGVGELVAESNTAGELVNRFCREHQALPALELAIDSSVLTCPRNDISFDEVFSRQAVAFGELATRRYSPFTRL